MVHETRAARGEEIHDTKTIKKIRFLLVGEDARHGCLGIAMFQRMISLSFQQINMKIGLFILLIVLR